MLSRKQLVQTITITMALLIVGGLLGPAMKQKDAAFDQQILDDFALISSEISAHFVERGRLPDSLADLELEEAVATRATNRSYEIEKEDASSYKLCATFKTESTDEDMQKQDNEIDLYYPEHPSQHDAGYDCIEYRVYGYTTPSLGGYDDVELPQAAPGFEGLLDIGDVESDQVFEL